MKKFFLFLAALCCTMGLMATNVHVSDQATLSQELGASGVMDTVTVDEDFDVTIVITQSGSKVLDLNSHALNIQYNILLTGDLTITGNGSLIGVEGMYSALFTINGAANLIIQNGTFDMSKNAQRIIFVNIQDAENTATGSVTINGGLFLSGNNTTVMHLQCASADTHNGVINGGVFVNKHSYLGAFSDAGNNKMDLTLKKCVLVNIDPSNTNVANMYSSAAQYIIPAGKRYVLNGSGTKATEAISFNGLQAKVCYVGDDDYSLFQNFNLMASNADTHVYGITSGGNAYGHAAHTAVVVYASPRSGFAKLQFTTTPAHDITPLEIAKDVYLIMPYVGGESINITGLKESISAIDITSKEGCIPAVGENFWNLKSTASECAAIMTWPEGVYAGSAMWLDETKSVRQEASAVCEAGKTYYLYIKFYLQDGWEWGPLPTATMNGEEASINGYHEVFYKYETTSTSFNANANVNANVNKRLVNGQLLIQREGRIYNVTGAEVK